MTDPPVSFNLWTEPWIRVTCQDGRDAELSIGDCLMRAHTLVGLSDPSPLVVGGTHRLLAAILQAIYKPQELGDVAAVLRSGRFDPTRLEAFATQYADRFDLFHPTAPFLQTGDVPLDGWKKPGKGQKHDWSSPKPVAALFVEVPTETNRAHFHHVTDEDHRLCPACCARGLITIPAFASSGGAGIRPSINGVPPVYVLPAGDSLFESLALSLISQPFQPRSADPGRSDLAIWNGATAIGKNSQVSAVGYLESLTFPARRMRLYPHRATENCTSCGAPTAIVVSDMLFEMGHWLSEGSGIWEDPFAAFRLRGKGDNAEPRPVRPEEGKALWREYSGLLLVERDGQFRPRVVQQIAKLVEQGVIAERQNLRFRCIGVRTDGKAKFFEWIDEALEAVPALLTDDEAAYLVDEAIERAGEIERLITFTFDRQLRPERSLADRVDQRVVRFKSLRARMTASYWQLLAPLFRAFLNDLVDESGREQTARRWVTTLVRVAQRAFDQATEQIGDRADALRTRVLAQEVCRYQLAVKRKEWLGEQQ